MAHLVEAKGPRGAIHTADLKLRFSLDSGSCLHACLSWRKSGKARRNESTSKLLQLHHNVLTSRSEVLFPSRSGRRTLQHFAGSNGAGVREQSERGRGLYHHCSFNFWIRLVFWYLGLAIPVYFLCPSIRPSHNRLAFQFSVADMLDVT
eukprot:1150778-Pelagomonas_calceolata.AAC.3